MQDEQGPDRQPEAWTAWSAQPQQPGQHQDARSDQPVAPAAEPAAGQPAAKPTAGQPGAGFGQPAPSGFSAENIPPPPPPPPGFAHPGPSGQPPGYGQQGDYGQGGGFTPPGSYGQAGGYGQPGGYPHPGAYGQPYGHVPYPQYGYGPYGPPRPRRRIASAIAYIAIAAVAAVAGGLVVDVAGNHTSPPSANSGTNNGSGNGLGNQGNNGNGTGNGAGSGNPYVGDNPSISSATVRKVQNAVMPGLVVISSNLQYQGDAAAATGMVISSNGLVLTNNHVIDQTTALTATVVSTGRRFQARWLGYDKSADIAVIQLVGASGLRTVPIGNSDTARLHDGVIAMGNANGTGEITTVTGAITGLDKSITASDSGTGNSEQLTGMIETDSHIIPGDSGGPLASLSGRVIGMDTAASSNVFGNQGPQNVGFAIPINRAMTIARQIIAGRSSSAVRVGSVGFLGVLVTGGKNNQQSTLTSPNAQLQQTIRNDESNGFGATPVGPDAGCATGNTTANVPSKIAPVSSGTLILGALCNTPATQVGLVPGDVITSVDGHAVSSPASMVTILAHLHSGQTIPVTWVTPSDQTVTRPLTLAAAPPT
jgi:S1-C subfamily serine protease